MPKPLKIVNPFAIDPAGRVRQSARPLTPSGPAQPQMTASTSCKIRPPPDHPRLRRAGPRRGRDGRVAALRAARRCRTLCERVLAHALALPFLALWARLGNRRAAAAWRGTDRAVVLSGLLFAGDLFFWHLAILATTVANATFLATTAPIWVALGAWLCSTRRSARASSAGLRSACSAARRWSGRA